MSSSPNPVGGSPVDFLSRIALEALRSGEIPGALDQIEEFAASCRTQMEGLELRRIELFVDEVRATLLEAAGMVEEARSLHGGILEDARANELHPDEASRTRFLAGELAVLARLAMLQEEAEEARGYLAELGALEGELLLPESSVVGIAGSAVEAWSGLAEPLTQGEAQLLFRLIGALHGEPPVAPVQGDLASRTLSELLVASEPD